jgi:hypothetical protein
MTADYRGQVTGDREQTGKRLQVYTGAVPAFPCELFPSACNLKPGERLTAAVPFNLFPVTCNV